MATGTRCKAAFNIFSPINAGSTALFCSQRSKTHTKKASILVVLTGVKTLCEKYYHNTFRIKGSKSNRRNDDFKIVISLYVTK